MSARGWKRGNAPRRYEVRNDARVIARARELSTAIAFAVRIAVNSGSDAIILDELADLGDVWLWIVRPSGMIEPTERRSDAGPGYATTEELPPC